MDARKALHTTFRDALSFLRSAALSRQSTQKSIRCRGRFLGLGYVRVRYGLTSF